MSGPRIGKGPSTIRYALGTVIYLLIVAIGAYLLGFLDPNGKPIEPSEWGDVLAGLFSPLAFLWLLYAALSQRAELELQRWELARNNETQHEQQREMSRQADALLAQTRKMEAQAQATYEPIFVLRRMEGKLETDSFLVLNIQNVGGTALNVHSDSSLSLDSIVFGQEYPGANVPAGIVAYWPPNARVNSSLALDQVDKLAPTFSLSFRRLDALTVTHKYVLTHGGKRIELREVIYEEDIRGT
ncbi:hypothetical protein [Pseudoxanthomonas sp.]|uniref:hypothetical protein n=1 Tax=Pseudoxanthomonas sp. TaxID=1871049 RepID=UPI002587EB1E|nr:hypothetical protein [Pseudoxanthomonas sp.]MCR6686734.1 hypothetical protein [Pseudoxanthomonas sp.]